MKKIENILKSNLKGKIRLSKALMITFLITGAMTSIADTTKYSLIAGENNEYSGTNVTILGNNNVSYGDNSSVFSVFTKEELEELGKIIDFRKNKYTGKSMLEYNLRTIDFSKDSDQDISRLNDEIRNLQNSPDFMVGNLYLPNHSVVYPFEKVYTEEKLRSLGFKDPDVVGIGPSSGYHSFVMGDSGILNDNVIAEKNKVLSKLEEVKNSNIEKYNKMKEIINNKAIAGLENHNLKEDKTLVRLLTEYKDTFHTENSKAEVQDFFEDYHLMKELAYFESDKYKELESKYLKMKEIGNQIREKTDEKERVWSEKKVVKETEIRNKIEDLERTNEEYNTRFEEIVDSHDETRGKREMSEIAKTIDTESISLGYSATTESKQSITIGSETYNKGEGSVVLGYGIQNEANNAVVLGKNSTGKDNTVSVGSEGNERKIIWVADGEISATSKEAINGSQLHKYLENMTNLAFDGVEIKEEINMLNNYDHIKDDKPFGTIFKDKDDKVVLTKVSVPTKEELVAITGEFSNIDFNIDLLEKQKSEVEGSSDSDKDVKLEKINKSLTTLKDLKDTMDTYDGSFEKFEKLRDTIRSFSKDANLNDFAVDKHHLPGSNLKLFKEYKLDKLADVLEYKHMDDVAVKLSNVAAGELSVNSTDAVNGSQLFEFKTILDTKLGDSDITHNYLSNKLEKGNIVSSTLTLTNNEGRIIGSNDLSIELKDSSVGFNHLDQDLKDLINSKGSGVSNPTNINIKSGDTTKAITDGNTVEYADGKGTKASIKEIDSGVTVKYDVNIDNSTIKLDGEGNLTVNTDMFANKDASNLDDGDVTKWRDKLGINNGGNNEFSENNGAISYNLPSNLGDTNFRIANVGDAINPYDAINKKQFDTKIDELNARLNSANAGVASALATASTLKNLGNGKHTISASLGYYERTVAGAIAYSTHYKNFGFLANASFNSDKKFGAGVGMSYTFGKDEKINETVNVVAPAIVVDNDDKLRDLENKNKELNDKLNDLMSFVKNIKITNENNFEVYTVSGFDSNEYVLKNNQIELIDKLLSNFENKEIIVIGYTDTDGNDKYNLDLGLNRANSVRDYLESKGLKVKQTRTAGFNDLIRNNSTSVNKAMNRRVEIIIK